MVLKINKSLFFPLILTIFSVLSFPSLILSQTSFPSTPSGQVVSIQNILIIILNIIWPIVVTLVIIFFVTAGFKFLTAQGDPNKVGEARRFLIWAIVGIIVIILAFSIITIVKTTFGLS